MEWYRGKPILYGLGHFVFDCAFDAEKDASEERRALLAGLSEEEFGYQIAPRKGWPLMPMHPDARMSVFAWAKLGAQGVSEIGFVPCRLRPDGRVEPVDPACAEGDEVLRYMRVCNETQKLNARIELDGVLELAGHRSVRVSPLPA